MGVQIPVCIRNLVVASQLLAPSFFQHLFRPQQDQRFFQKKKTHSIGINLGILLLKHVSLGSRDIDHAINDRMCHMHPLRPKLLAQTLRQSSQGEFACREGCGEGGATDGGCSAREDERGRMLWFGVGGGDEEGEGRASEEIGAESISRTWLARR